MKHKKKILFVANKAYSLFNTTVKGVHGGMEQQLFLLGKELAKNKKFEVSFAVGNFNQKKTEVFGDVKVFRNHTHNPYDSIISRLLKALSFFFLIIKIKPDVCFTSSSNAIMAVVGLYCKVFGKKHIHRTASQVDVDGTESKRLILGKAYTWGLKNANTILTQSVEHQKLILKNYRQESVVFKNVIDIKSQEIEKQSRKYVLWVSRYEKLKQPELFIALAKSNPELKFKMVMPVNEQQAKEHKADYFKFVEMTKSISNIDFVDFVPFENIQGIFNEAKVLVNTSIYEGFPNTFLHAGVSGVPILSLNVNPDNFINEHNCGFYCNNKAEELDSGLHYILDASNFEKMSKNVFKYVYENHNINTQVKNLASICY